MNVKKNITTSGYSCQNEVLLFRLKIKTQYFGGETDSVTLILI